MAFTFIRHGETVNNRKGLYQGWSDPSLLVTEKCRLRSVRDRYPNPCFIITSDLKRCVETATTLFPEKRVFYDPGFRELNFGDFEEKSYEQLKDVPAYRTWLAQPFHERPPNGESFQTFTDRLQKVGINGSIIFIKIERLQK